MPSVFVLLSWMFVGAGVTGPFSGVSLDNLLDAPLLQERAIAGGDAAELAELAVGTEREKRDGQTVLVTRKGFEITLDAHLLPGPHAVVVEAAGINGSTDSYYVELNGKRLERVLTIPIDVPEKRKLSFHIAKEDDYTVRLVLRESPGSFLRSARLVALTIDTDKPAMRAKLRKEHPRLLLTSETIDSRL